MGNSVQIFKDLREASLLSKDQAELDQITTGLLKGFVGSTKQKFELLGSHLKDDRIVDFYNLLPEFKCFVEYSDELNRYYYLLRGYSGALAKLKERTSVKEAKRIYAYYFGKYGDRRLIVNEHWLEKKRWEFLDELQGIYSEFELSLFIEKFQYILKVNFRTYKHFLFGFLGE